MRRGLLLLLLIGLATVACASASSTAPSTTSQSTTPSFVVDDLFEEPELDVRWRRNIRGLTVLGDTAQPIAEEIELLTAAISDLPAVLLERIDVRYLIRTDEAPGNLHEATLAFARGPDIYLTAATFADLSRADLGRVLIHEMTHVAQFSDLDLDYLERAAAAGVTLIDVATASNLVQRFAADIGWVDLDTDDLESMWELPAGKASGTTTYGRSSPDEDHAESLSYVASGRAALLSEDRVRWIETWIGVTEEQLSMGWPWIPPGSVESRPDTDLYDTEALDQMAVRHIEPAYWALPADAAPAPDLATEIASRLRLRGLAGRLEEIEDARLTRFQGRFVRADGYVLWVELWDFRGATGFSAAPEGPVLTYVAAW